MNKTGLILFHGFFEHKERHRPNAEWFENLGIETHLVDLPGHGERAIEKGIKEVAFDRSGYKYHGRVKALADSAREAGLTF